MKAIAEFVENSIDAHAKTITITRGKEHGAHYLAIKDDGDGVPRDPDFKKRSEIKLTYWQQLIAMRNISTVDRDCLLR